MSASALVEVLRTMTDSAGLAVMVKELEEESNDI